MNWDNLSDDIINIILKYRKYFTCSVNASIFIQKMWKSYKIKVLMKRYLMLRYIKDFRIWNPSANEYILRTRI